MGTSKDIDWGRVYFDPSQPGSFGGVEALTRATGGRREDARKWLEKLISYTVHKPIRKKFPRRMVQVRGPFSGWQADLVDMQAISKDNDGKRFILTVIDVFSKLAFSEPLKNKTGVEVTKAFRNILKRSGKNPKKLHTDFGTEFLNSTFQKMLKSEGIGFFTTLNTEIKASIVERFNRTIKSRLWRYFTHMSSYRWVDALQSFMDSYNSTYHRSIGMRPIDVKSKNVAVVRKRLYGGKPSSPVAKFVVGDSVRITKARMKFAKAFWPNWSEEIFVVGDVLKTVPITYSIKDTLGEPILGTFYAEELQSVQTPDLYRVESVLDSRGRGVRKEYLIKWYGYPASHNSWTLATNVERNFKI